MPEVRQLAADNGEEGVMVRRRNIYVNGIKKKYSHVVWHKNTGHWPRVPDEVIHHIDRDITNDSFDNLRLMSDSAHKSLHAQGVIPPSSLGRIATEKTRAKLRTSKMGDKNPNWKGDDASPHAKYQRIWRAERRGA